jgi:hypothetical protein
MSASAHALRLPLKRGTGLSSDILLSLLDIRAAQIRGEQPPVVAPALVLRLRHMLMSSTRLNSQGDAFLELFFLFCRKPACAGVLHGWTSLRSVPVPPSLLLGPVPGNAGSSYFMKCPECGSLNVLDARSYPTSRSDFRIVQLIAAS